MKTINNGRLFESKIYQFLLDIGYKVLRTSNSGAKRNDSDIVLKSKFEDFRISCKLQESGKNLIIKKTDFSEIQKQSNRLNSIPCMILAKEINNINDTFIVLNLKDFIEIIRCPQ